MSGCRNSGSLEKIEARRKCRIAVGFCPPLNGKYEQRRIKGNLRSRLTMAVTKGHKSCSAVSDLGCSIEFFKEYMASKFTEGMSWDNYGKYGWHIDHIFPLSKVDLSDPIESKKACHYTNLQPLWRKDNISKGNKIINT